MYRHCNPKGENQAALWWHHAIVAFVIIVPVQSATDVCSSCLQVLALYIKGLDCQKR